MLDRDAQLLEALLFVSTEPVEPDALSTAAGLTDGQTLEALDALERHYFDEGHGIRLERSASAVRLVTAPAFGGFVAHFQGLDRQARLSAAAMDALAIVAYRQPVTRSVVEAIRGVGSEHVLTVLLNTGLIEEVGRADSIGRPVLYATAVGFLEAAGLTSLADLPAFDRVAGQANLFD